MRQNKKAKDKIFELKKRLDDMLVPENLQSEEVLKISKELDILIMKFYSGSILKKEVPHF